MTRRRITHLAALALATAAVTVSSAAAMPARNALSHRSHAAMQPVVSVVKASQPTSTADGFHWGDAGLGAGIIVSVLAAVGSAVYLVQRRRGLSHRQPRSIG
jgi:sensor c-di-GMP phosphodiesterase-like protein